MPLPVAHGLIGASIVAGFHRSPRSHRWRMLVLGAILGICPDFDYALNWLRVAGGGWHHGFTHSITFALIVGAATALALRDWTLRTILTLAAAVFSHSLLDYLMTESRGVALFWPLTNWRYKHQLFSPINYSWDDGSLTGAVANLLRISVLELLIFGPITLLVMVIARRVSKHGAA